MILLQNISCEIWDEIYQDLQDNQKAKFAKNSVSRRQSTLEQSRQKSSDPVKQTAPTSTAGLLITTEDAHTLTDGPTIFLSNNVENLGKYYIKQTNLPDRVYKSLYTRIEQNTSVQKKLSDVGAQIGIDAFIQRYY